MNVTYSEKARQGGRVFTLLQQATKQLEEVLGPSAEQVTVEWDCGPDERGRALYTLRIQDHTGEASTRFAPEELESSSHLRFRLLDLWGDLLQRRSDAQLKRLQQLVQQELVQQGE